MQQRQWFVYIMASKRYGTLYTGVTSNLPQRVWQHKTRLFPDCFTARYGCLQLVYYEPHDYYAPAITREKAIKKWPRQWKMNAISAMNPEWRDLSEDF